MVPGTLILSPSSNPGFSATVSPFELEETTAGSSGTTSSTVTVTPVGGSSPFTYEWTQLSGDMLVSANSPTANTTDFDFTIGGFGFYTATMQCLVEDNASRQTTVLMSVIVTRTGSQLP